MQNRDSFGLRATPDTGGSLPPLSTQLSTDQFQQEMDIAADPVHLLLCINALYLQHAAVCLTSLLANNQDLFFNIVVVARPTEILDEEKLHRSLANFSNYSLLLTRFTPPAAESLPLNPGAHYTVDNWIRLWVEHFFGSDVDRALY